MKGPRPAPISFTYLDRTAASDGPAILDRVIEGARKRRGRSDSERDERSDENSLHAYTVSSQS